MPIKFTTSDPVDENLPGFSCWDNRQGLHTAALSSYIGTMQETPARSRHKLYGGIAVSVALHVIIAIALFVRLPVHDQTPAKEETVSVEIVPPPEEKKPDAKKPEQKKPEQQALNLKMPEEKPQQDKQKPAPPPEPPKQQADKAGAKPPEPAAKAEEKKPDQNEAKQPPPPPPAPPEKAKKEEAPPPPPAPTAPEKAAPKPAKEETPPPPPPPAEKNQAEQQKPPSSDQKEQAASMPVLRPVVQFGDKDTGPRKSLNGDAAQDSGAPSDIKDATAQTDAQAAAPEDKTKPTTDAAQTPAGSPTPDTKLADMPQGLRLPPDITLPGVDLPANGSAAIGMPSAVSPDTKTAIVAAMPPANTSAKPAPKAANAPRSGLKQAKTLFSTDEGGDAVATTAMDNIPRRSRVAQLCSTELQMQLRHAGHFPDILPSYGVSQGTVLDVPSAAFHGADQWFDLSYRCEIDQNATKVVSFALNVGNAIPRNQWKQRGLPAF